jgi:hypothetical protein
MRVKKLSSTRMKTSVSSKKEELIIVEEWLHLEAHNEPKEAVQRENE